MNIKVNAAAVQTAVYAARLLIVNGVLPVARTLYRVQQERIEALRETNVRLERVEKKLDKVLYYTDSLNLRLSQIMKQRDSNDVENREGIVGRDCRVVGAERIEKRSENL